jgi:lysozyme
MNQSGYALLKEFEGFRRSAYPDPATGGDPWTIGYGFTQGVHAGDQISKLEADARLIREVDIVEREVLAGCQIRPNENQLAALVCFAYNIGTGNLRKSTVLKAHNRGDEAAASRAFALWNKAGGRVMPGLTRRRAAEAALYLKPVAGEGEQMPQRVDPESNLGNSPIVRGASLAAVSSTVGMAAEGARSVHDIRDSLGDWLPYVMVAVVIGAAGSVIWQRVKQRRGGWA